MCLTSWFASFKYCAESLIFLFESKDLACSNKSQIMNVKVVMCSFVLEDVLELLALSCDMILFEVKHDPKNPSVLGQSLLEKTFLYEKNMELHHLSIESHPRFNQHFAPRFSTPAGGSKS